MTHDVYRELVLLAASGSVDDGERAILDRHLASCDACRRDFEEQTRLHGALLAGGEGIGPDDRLLAEARQELRIALRKERSAGSFRVRLFGPGAIAPAFRLAAGAACALVAGVLIGRTVLAPSPGEWPEGGVAVRQAGGAVPREEPTRITNVHFIDHGSAGGEIEFTFDAVTPVRMRGSIDDPKIQKVLTHAMLNEENPGVRLKAVNVINTHGAEARDADVKSALIKALEMDANVGVRKEALNALRRFAFDDEIKHALLRALVADGNPGMRVAAINALDSARTGAAGVDNDILTVLKQKAETDDNNYIRVKARAVIQEAIQR